MADKKAPKKKSTNKTQPKTKSASSLKAAADGRTRKLTRRSEKKQAKVAIRQASLPSAWSLLKSSIKHLYTHKRLFIGILLVYGLLNLLFARGISGSFQLSSLNKQLTDSFGSDISGLSKGTALFGLLLGTGASTSSEAGSIYQTIFIVLTSLALIWALRNTYSEKKKIRVKEAYYKSTQPLVPFILVGLLIAVQLIPLLVTASLYSTVQSGGLAASGPEQVLWAVVLMIGAATSLFFTCSSLMALYIVTLPGTHPRVALKAARKLVRLRRIIIIRKILFLPAALLFFMALVLIPLIIILAPAAEVLFLVSTILLLGVFHSYYYSLYRSLL